MGIEDLKRIIDTCFVSASLGLSPVGDAIAHQFSNSVDSAQEALKSANAAFLICLTPEAHCLHSAAMQFINGENTRWLPQRVLDLYKLGVELIKEEVEAKVTQNPDFDAILSRTARWLESRADGVSSAQLVERLWEVFFPEGAALRGSRDRHVRELRDIRRVVVREANRSPIRSPVEEILFTANVLLTTPLSHRPEDLQLLSPKLAERVLEVSNEPQRYWYDHPIPAGTPPENNEVIYGLRSLNEAVAFEKNKRGVCSEARLSCALSVSVTHEGLQDVAKAIVADMIKFAGELEHLEVFLWTENETRLLVEKILAPSARYYMGVEAQDSLHRVIGVNGEYGRHYSFLRALAAIWKVCVLPALKGTFKIDLDQVFPQEQLVAETGRSAFEHFMTPLWGANGIDSRGRPVHLGMIAGALVNYEDAGLGLFIPDVRYPAQGPQADEWVFFSRLPQAISTEAEMMTRYEKGPLTSTCIQRIHVTGGTCGILLDALTQYRPFTPTFVSRAEDQAYLLSVLFKGDNKFLRYVHKDGLIMRHDKEAFATEAIRAAEAGKFVGDLARILIFSYYAEALPWGKSTIKTEVNPFTGCFISEIPITIAFMRLALRAAWLFEQGESSRACELIETAAARLLPIIEKIKASNSPFREAFEMEKRAWDTYYDVVEHISAGLEAGDPKAVEIARRGKELIDSTRVK